MQDRRDGKGAKSMATTTLEATAPIRQGTHDNAQLLDRLRTIVGRSHVLREHRDLWGFFFMLPRAERPQPHYRWRDWDTISRKESGACHRARGFGSAAAGAHRASSTAFADVCRSAC